MRTIQIVVRGRVQGVYFRAYTQKQAVKLNINGFVKNNTDGAVEIIACGTEEDLDTFITWCHKGSLLAKVSHVNVTNFPTPDMFKQFSIR